MNPFTVPSSALAGWAYEAATKQLRIQFADGTVHGYADVPAQVVEELVRAQSPGGFFNGKIRRCFAHWPIKSILS
jgi:hypothetical protein